MKQLKPLILGASLLLLLAACGGGGGGSAFEPDNSGGTDQTLTARSVNKLLGRNGQWAALAQRARPLENNTAPDRELLLSRAAPAAALRWQPPEGWSLIDMAWHASGQLSLVLATSTTLRLLRLDAQAQVLADQAFTDPLTVTDPVGGYGPTGPSNDWLLPRATRDAVRVAARGEDLVLVLRSGRHAVVAHGLQWQGGAFNKTWRTLVEPAVDIGAVGLTSGTFDPFASVDNQWHVLLDVAPDGRIAVAVSLGYTDLVAGHAEHFGETIDPEVTQGALLTRLSASGQRLSTTVIDSGPRSELYGLRWAGDRIVLAGRVRPSIRPDGSSWDGWLAWVAADSGALLQQQVLDVDRSDVLFDAAPLPGGRWLLAGATGYLQNPGGRSISEEAAPLLAVLPAAGQPAQRLSLPATARHNQARSLAAGSSAARWWVGGMHNGPGTHSADADPALLTADGFVRAVEVP